MQLLMMATWSHTQDKMFPAADSTRGNAQYARRKMRETTAAKCSAVDLN